MSILKVISDLFEPATKLIDDLHTSEEEKLAAKVGLEKIKNEMSIKALEYDTKLLESRSKIINSEATGQSWIQRSWRPITMITFLVLIVLDSLGFLAHRLSEDAWTLFQLGLGGYVVGRSAEKITPKLKESLFKG